MSHAVFFYNEYASYGWLAFQNRMWTADRLIIQGWLNQIVCPYANDNARVRASGHPDATRPSLHRCSCSRVAHLHPRCMLPSVAYSARRVPRLHGFAASTVPCARNRASRPD